MIINVSFLKYSLVPTSNLYTATLYTSLARSRNYRSRQEPPGVVQSRSESSETSGVFRSRPDSSGVRKPSRPESYGVCRLAAPDGSDRNRLFNIAGIGGGVAISEAIRSRGPNTSVHDRTSRQFMCSFELVTVELGQGM